LQYIDKLNPKAHNKIYKKIIKKHNLDLNKHPEFLKIMRNKNFFYLKNEYGLEKLEDRASCSMDDFISLLEFL